MFDIIQRKLSQYNRLKQCFLTFWLCLHPYYIAYTYDKATCANYCSLYITDGRCEILIFVKQTPFDVHLQ